MADSCQCMTKPLQYCKVISLQLIKINEKKENRKISINNLTLHLKSLEKEKTKPKVSRRKEIKIRKEINGKKD